LSDGQGLSLSVRGEAHQSVAPDLVVLAGRVTVAGTSKPDAVEACAKALEVLTAELAALGGLPLTVEYGRSVLTWSAYSATTHFERDHNAKTGRHEPTGRVLASVDLNVAVRDFSLLEALGAVFARLEAFNLNGVSWYVDDDNPAWPALRTAAIEAALRKARDYAGALGGSLISVEHVADVGLLAGSGESPRVFRAMAGRAASAGGPGDGVEAPSLDPVPQEITAVIEARCRATSSPLAGT